jgi:hypothetical protein
MRRSYVLAIAVISVYCLTDAFASSGGEQADRSGRPVFSAEIVDAPIVSPGNPVAPVFAASSPEGMNVAADPVTEAEKPTVDPAPVASAPAPKPRAVASAAPRRAAPVSKPERIAPPAELAVSYAAPSRQPAMQPMAVAHVAPAASGCSGARWSQPDAAGVPVLLCN